MEDLIYGFKILLIGTSVVFTALVVVALMLTLFGYINQWLTQSAPLIQPASDPELPHNNAISPEILAVISAAIAVTVGANAQIKRIRVHRGAEGSAWQTQGRASLISSHALPRKSNR